MSDFAVLEVILKRNLSYLGICAVLLAAMIIGRWRLGVGGIERSLKRQSWGLNTLLNFTIYGGQEKDLDDALALVKRYEGILDRNPPALLGQLNLRKTEQIGEELASLISRSRQVGLLTGGALDITLGRAVELWDFGGHPRVPDGDELAEAMKGTGWAHLSVKGDRVRFDNPFLKVDLGAVAKGFVADRLKDFFLKRGIRAGIIDLGGNVLTFGTKPGGKPWVIGLRDPFGSSRSVALWTFRGDAALVTSGVYERGFEKDGLWYHHLLDPRTGMPINSGLRAVTVKSDRAELADALSTAFFVCGRVKAEVLIREHFPDVTVVFFDERGRGSAVGRDVSELSWR